MNELVCVCAQPVLEHKRETLSMLRNGEGYSTGLIYRSDHLSIPKTTLSTSTLRLVISDLLHCFKRTAIGGSMRPYLRSGDRIATNLRASLR
ncbi:hypothetical protein AGR6A_pAt60253 [Agrobacterium sp. NCPPB 925]|nr:hypothetical protein AGR6A_pAt60253 [Agrobacterium sp. NCPPB 925]